MCFAFCFVVNTHCLIVVVCAAFTGSRCFGHFLFAMAQPSALLASMGKERILTQMETAARFVDKTWNRNVMIGEQVLVCRLLLVFCIAMSCAGRTRRWV